MKNKDAQIITDFGMILRSQRFKKGLTLRKAAAICGISTSYYHYIEHAQRPGISLLAAAQIAEQMDIEIVFKSKSQD